jgi:hypothetical protein
MIKGRREREREWVQWAVNPALQKVFDIDADAEERGRRP